MLARLLSPLQKTLNKEGFMLGHTVRGHGLLLPLDLGRKTRYHGGECMKEGTASSHGSQEAERGEEATGPVSPSGIPSVA